MKLIIIMALFSLNVFAFEDSTEIDFITEMDDEVYREANPRIYRGEGEHQCQSRESIGHTCKNLGVNFTDCNQAFFKLKLEDCCSGSKYGGTTINFKLLKCTNFN